MKLQTEIEHKLSGRMALASRAFILIAAAGILGVLAMLAYSQRWFTPTLDLYFYADKATGLNRGMAVKLVGFNVGSLEQVAVVGELRVRGKVAMDRRYRDSVGKDARIRLTREGLIGSYVLELIPGQGDPGPVDDGSTLTFERELDYSSVAAGLLDRVGPVIDDLRTITSQLVDPKAGVPTTVRNLNDAAVELGAMSRGIRSLAEEGGKVARDVPARVEPVLKDLQRSLAQIESLTRTLNQALPPMIDDTRASLQNLRRASENAQRVIAEDVPRILRRSESALGDAEEILGAARRSWPVKNMLPPAEEKPIELDSADGAGLAPPRKPAP